MLYVFTYDLITVCSQYNTPVNSQLILPKKITHYHQPQITKSNNTQAHFTVM